MGGFFMLKPQGLQGKLKVLFLMDIFIFVFSFAYLVTF
jgi:hypothetical protein